MSLCACVCEASKVVKDQQQAGAAALARQAAVQQMRAATAGRQLTLSASLTRGQAVSRGVPPVCSPTSVYPPRGTCSPSSAGCSTPLPSPSVSSPLAVCRRACSARASIIAGVRWWPCRSSTCAERSSPFRFLALLNAACRLVRKAGKRGAGREPQGMTLLPPQAAVCWMAPLEVLQQGMRAAGGAARIPLS